jgi:hypothetical protein
MPIKSFRGLLLDGTKETVFLHTNDGSTGYRITKFTVLPNQPFNKTQESVLKIYKVPQTGAPTGVVDFSDQTLLAAAIFKGQDSTSYPASTMEVFFDNEIFNQDLYVTCYDAATGEALNYYFELEQIKLDLTENTVATLKDIRNQ